MNARSSARHASPFRVALGFTAGHWARHRQLVLLITLTVIGQTLADVAMPVFAGRLVDAIATGESNRDAARDAALLALAVMIGLGFVMLILRDAGFRAIIRLTLRMSTDVGQEAFWRVQRFSTDWHANTFAGSTVRRISRGMAALDLLNDTVLIALLPSAVVLVGSTVLLAWHWPIMGLVVLLGAGAYVAVTATLSLRYVAPAARLSNSWDTRLGGALADAISCNPVVKAFGAEAREDARLARLIEKWRRRTHRTWTRGTNNGSLQWVMLLLLRTAVLGTAILLWWQGRATPGDVTYVLTTYFLIHGYLREVGMHIRNLQRSVNDMEELIAFHHEPLGVADRAGARPIRIAKGRVEFRHVTFHYRGHGARLFRDLSLVIRPGERVGLVGHSGSGKSTFVKLVQRLYDVSGGAILIDGQDVATATQASLRAQIAIVQQEPILFHRSLAENIAYARPTANAAEIEAAARLANAHEFIAHMPNGYRTLVGERGVKLSGGERQRVALARAFLADAPILILDEATSSLDSESEALIQEAMHRLIERRTAIVIAHRLSTVKALDRILVFEAGRIIEEGDHATLIARPNGTYRRLFERQALELMEGLAA
jgi:ATP-binding cassette subfamily B protein